MLRRLFIKNLVLVSSCELIFQEGFTVLTGESGVGKSVVLSALSLVLGQKQETTLIRQGEQEAIVEASFDDCSPQLHQHLLDAGISHEEGEELIIKRVLSQSGKSKTFVNNQAATSSFLKKIAPFLIRFSAQHAHIALFDQDVQQDLLDTYAHLAQEKKAFQKVLSEHTAVVEEIETIQKQDILTLVEMRTKEIDELESAHLTKAEDEELFAQYSSMLSLQGLKAQLHELYETFDTAILQAMLTTRSSFDRLVKQDANAEPLHSLYTTITNDCKELCYELASWVKKTDVDHTRLQEIEERLRALDALKKKYKCETCDTLIQMLEAKKQEVIRYNAKDLLLDTLQQKKQILEAELVRSAYILTEKRTVAAAWLSKKVSNLLQELSMPHAFFEIELIETPRTKNGTERALFYLAANKGFSKQRLCDAASGGELSRIFLAITCAMLEEEESTFLVFDEIDANVGGKTAGVIGEKLQALGKKHQVLAITHFPQVAKCAHHHVMLTKEEKNNSTYTHALPLINADMRDNEYLRMVGVENAG